MTPPIQATNTTFWRAFCRHMWFEFGCWFFAGYSGFPRPTFPNSNFSLERTCLVFFNLPLNTWSEGNQKVDCPFKLFVCLCFFIFWQIILLTRMTNEHLRCITNIKYFTDITNIPQQIMLVFVGNNLGTTIWIKTFFKLKCGFNFIFSRYSVAWYCRQIFFPWRKLANYMTSFVLC